MLCAEWMQRGAALCPHPPQICSGFSAARVPRDLDAVVIGSGIGGLAAAGTLAKVGKRVLVLEQHDQAGGCCHTFQEQGSEFDVGKDPPAMSRWSLLCQVPVPVCACGCAAGLQGACLQRVHAACVCCACTYMWGVCMHCVHRACSCSVCITCTVCMHMQCPFAVCTGQVRAVHVCSVCGFCSASTCTVHASTVCAQHVFSQRVCEASLVFLCCIHCVHAVCAFMCAVRAVCTHARSLQHVGSAHDVCTQCLCNARHVAHTACSI